MFDGQERMDMWTSFLQNPRGAYIAAHGASGNGPLDTCDSFLQFVMWPGQIDMDMPPGAMWGTEEEARALDLLRQLKEY